MDELIKELQERAGLTEAQAKAAAEVVAEWMKDEDKRKKVIAASFATVIASAVVTGAI
jgi:nucleoid DNA-binding protein